MFKECPFCGSDDIEFEIHKRDSFRNPVLSCNCCDLAVSFGSFCHGISEEEVIEWCQERWNRRELAMNNPNDMYARFKIMDELIKPFKDNGAYFKLVKTGNAPIHDYGVGMMSFYCSVVKKMSINTKPNYCVLVRLLSIDDTDYGGCSKHMSKDDAVRLAEKIQTEMNGIDILPDDCDKMFMHHGVYMTDGY